MAINRNVRTTVGGSPSASNVPNNVAAGARRGAATAVAASSRGVSAPPKASVSQSVKGPKPAGRTNSTQPMSRGKIVHASNGAVGTSRPQNVVTSTKKR